MANLYTHVPSFSNDVSGGYLNNGSSTRVISGLVLGLKHNHDISLHWTPEEQAVLEQGLAQFAAESPLKQYKMIADQLKDKMVRDIALRVRWMSKKENCKRRKDDHSLTRKRTNKRERVSDPSANSSHFALLSNGDTSYRGLHAAIAGPTRELLERNEQAFNLISTNLDASQAGENIGLFRQICDGFRTIMNEFDSEPEKMKKLPPFPGPADIQTGDDGLPKPIPLPISPPLPWPANIQMGNYGLPKPIPLMTSPPVPGLSSHFPALPQGEERIKYF